MMRRVWGNVVCGVVGLLLLQALFVMMTWAPDQSVESLKGRWASGASGSRFVDVQGLAVHVRDEGVQTDAEPIVLLHGTGASLHTWDGWAAELAATRRVIRLDLPGFGLTGPHRGKLAGESGGFVGAEDYSTAMYVRFVVAALDALNVKQPVVLAGNSLGGQIAWEVALHAPSRVSSLVLVDAAGYPFVHESMPMAFEMALATPHVPGLLWMMEHTLPRFMVAASVRNVYHEPQRVSEALVDVYEAMSLREGNRRTLALRLVQLWAERDTPQGKAEGVTQRLKQIKHPTLILWGEGDRLIPKINAQWFGRDIALSQTVVFPGLGHVPHEEDAKATVSVVKAFLAAKQAAN
jgi:pimeloyl-ACP methyl ester carboxylesterase